MEPGLVTQESVPPPKPERKTQRQKTFTGCWDCRSRKVKCDEAAPECTPCRRRGFSCGGYDPVLVWATPNRKGYEAGRRRALKSYLTWRGHRLYTNSEVEGLIAHCDTPQSDEGGFHDTSAGPFTVFPYVTNVPSPRAPPSDINQVGKNLPDKSLRFCAGFLFHHYLTYIALNMMPFEDRRNPWQSFYPLMAQFGKSSGHRSLLYAILAQAAGSLSYMGFRQDEMSYLTIKCYGLAVEDLRLELADERKDFTIVLASILTLIMAEVYNGKSKAWRLHLQGAWNFITSHQINDEPCHRSEEAWLTTQSLCVLKIRCDTMQQHPRRIMESGNLEMDATRTLISSIASRADFGFTTGASPALLSCIIETTAMASRCSQDGVVAHWKDADRLYQKLRACSHPHEYPDGHLIQIHHRIFQLGAMTYFHRSVLHSPPQLLVGYIDEIINDIKRYRERGGGHVTLWPVFVAAVEAYQECHQASFRAWLDDCEKMGAASRKDIRELIESVWQRRASIGLEMGAEERLGEVEVDWREVMCESGLDVLLV